MHWTGSKACLLEGSRQEKDPAMKASIESTHQAGKQLDRWCCEALSSRVPVGLLWLVADVLFSCTGPTGTVPAGWLQQWASGGGGLGGRQQQPCQWPTASAGSADDALFGYACRQGLCCIQARGANDGTHLEHTS
jgi:hypothetical protein